MGQSFIKFQLILFIYCYNFFHTLMISGVASGKQCPPGQKSWESTMAFWKKSPPFLQKYSFPPHPLPPSTVFVGHRCPFCSRVPCPRAQMPSSARFLPCLLRCLTHASSLYDDGLIIKLIINIVSYYSHNYCLMLAYYIVTILVGPIIIIKHAA